MGSAFWHTELDWTLLVSRSVEKTFGKKNEVAVWKRWGKNSTGLAVVVIPSRQTLSLLERVVGLAPGSQGVDWSNFICIFSTLKAAEWGGDHIHNPFFFFLILICPFPRCVRSCTANCSLILVLLADSFSLSFSPASLSTPKLHTSDVEHRGFSCPYFPCPRYSNTPGKKETYIVRTDLRKSNEKISPMAIHSVIQQGGSLIKLFK